MGKNLSFFGFAIIAIALLAGCKGCDNSVDQAHFDDKAVIEMPEQYIAPLVTNLDAYFKTMSEERFEDYVELVYPAVFLTDSSKALSIKMMQEFLDMGVRNVTESFKLVYLSPFVEDSTQYYALVMMNVKHKIIFGEAYAGDPAELTPMIRSQYGTDSYTYDPVKREYDISTISRMYAITDKKEINFTFLNDQYLHSRDLANLLTYDIVFPLKQYEEVQNKRLKAGQ
ncbi:MAG: hypothetical protein GC193_15025 [Cryomorphaceae bacterium]|nr:hypothetical protein [Cryomorphaceae bacterium]